jgi:hypothetical protein
VSTDTVLASVTYSHADILNVQAGRFITPHGIINMEHFPALLLDPEQPQFLRPFTGQTIFPNFTDGINIFGSKPAGESGDNLFEYFLYGGNFAGNATHFNFGGRLAYTWGKQGITVGVNGTLGERIRTVASDYAVYGADLMIDRKKILWKSELYFTDEDLGGDRMGWYTQPGYRFNDRWMAFYRYDVLDLNRGDPGGESTENAVGLSFRPNPNAHIRGIYTHKDFETATTGVDEEADIFQLSGTFTF